MQLTVVDAIKFGRRGWMDAIEKEQLRTSSHLKVSKRDLVPPERFDEVVRAVQAVVPAARAVEAGELAEVIVDRLGARAAPERAPRLMSIGTGPRPEGTHLPHTFLSCQIDLPYPIEPTAMETFLAALPDSVLRAKGVMLLREPSGEKRSFQWVSGQGGEVSPCQLQDPETIAPVAIFVGSGLDVAALRAGLMALRA
jgi:G3E family GTPase